MANRRFIDFPIASTSGDTDIILIWQDGVNKQTTKATILSGLPENLDELNDVAISGLTNGQILRYDSVTGKWENTDQGNLDLNDLNDVSIVSPSNGQVLVYNSSTSKWENSSAGFVPYVGAVTTVDLGSQGLRAGYVRFDTSVVSVPDEQGLMYWDSSKSTVALIMNGTLQHIGQDTFFYCKNSTGSSIPKGTSVRFAGTDGASGHILITPFLANGSVPSNYFVGVTAEVIANGAFGQVMHFGELTGINTSSYSSGALLYASTTVAGGFQTTAPVAPNNNVLVAAAVNSKNNGAIVVRPTYGSNINTDEGVKITSGATGDLLQLQAGGLWENKTIDGAGIVTKATAQSITGTKTFGNSNLILASAFNANPTYLTNSGGSSSHQSGYNLFGFNTDNHLYFAKSSNTGANTGILAWSNTATRTYTLKDASGTLAFTSDIPSLSGYVQGSGTTNYLPKFTGASTIGDSIVFDNGTNVSIGATSTNGKLTVVSNPASWNNFANAQLRLGATISGNAISMLFTDGNNSNGWFGYQDNAVSANRYFYWSANDGASQQMQLNSSGNLGLGVTPSAWGLLTAMQIKGGAFISGYNNNTYVGANWYFDGSVGRYLNNDFATSYIQTDGEHQWLTATSGTAGNAISFTQAMTLTSGGNVLIGTTTDNGARLQVSGSASIGGTNTYNGWIIGSHTNNVGSALYNKGNVAQTMYADSANTILNAESTLFLRTANADKLTITSGGNVLIGTTGTIAAAGGAISQKSQANNNWIDYAANISTSGAIYGYYSHFSGQSPNNSTSAFFLGSDNSAERIRIYSNGGIANFQANNVNLSDERTKKEIYPLESYWDKFKQIEIVKFKYKDQTHDDFNIGVIAQQVEKVAPEFVDVDGWVDKTKDKNAQPLKTIYTADLYHASIKVLQEALLKIEKLEHEINLLKN